MNLTGADRTWGFRIGVDGMVSINDAMSILSLGRSKIYELMKSRSIRYAKAGRKVLICRRSLTEYLSTLEV